MDLDDLVARFRGPLIGLFAARGLASQAAIELAQDVFAEAYLSRMAFRGSWDDNGATGAWLRGIAKNLARSRARRDRRNPKAIGNADIQTEPAEHEAGEERRAQVRWGLDQLRESWRTVLYMRYVEGHGLHHIAALLGHTERAVEGRLHRARKELKRLLGQRHRIEHQDDQATREART